VPLLTDLPIFRHLSSEDWSEKPRGRPSLLSSADQYDRKDPANLPDIADFLAIETGKVIAVDTIRHMIGRLPGFKMIEGIPFEVNRMDCDPAAMERYFDDLERILVDFPCAMVVNVDETGHCDWVDARTQTVVVP
jgi:hypothetical protein